MIPPQHHADAALPSRRTVLRGTLLSATAAASATYLAACSSSSPRPGTPTSSQSAATTGSTMKRVLLAYFSRPGENYSYGGRTDLKVGNTEVLAQKIADRIACDTCRIQAAEPYPHDYDATVQRNVREQDTDARPAIEGRLPSVDGYDIILLASPIWNVRAPMSMTAFTEALDFRGKTVHPVTTYAMSGLGPTERDYAGSCPGATIAEGLAVRGEEDKDADTEVKAWPRCNVSTAVRPFPSGYLLPSHASVPVSQPFHPQVKRRAAAPGSKKLSGWRCPSEKGAGVLGHPHAPVRYSPVPCSERPIVRGSL